MTETEADSKREGKNHELQPLNISLSVGGKVLGINPTYNTGAHQKIRFKGYQAQSIQLNSGTTTICQKRCWTSPDNFRYPQ